MLLGMRSAVLAVFVFVAACGNDEHIVDAPAAPSDGNTTPTDASDGGVPNDGAVPIDADTRCAACGVNQVCVAYHDGTCSSNIRLECQDRNQLCEGLDCIADRDCEFWHCRGGTDAGTYICYSCPNDIDGAINCHGA
jgi:hypothetical protein